MLATVQVTHSIEYSSGTGSGHPGDALAGAGGDRAGDGGQHGGAVGGVAAESLDAEQAPVGGKADAANDALTTGGNGDLIGIRSPVRARLPQADL
jgi:hypothetical protein